MSGIVEAVRKGLLKGQTVAEAAAKGLLGKQPMDSENDNEGMSLCDALRKGLIEVKTGKVIDRFTGNTVKLSDAIKRGLICPRWLEIHDQNSKAAGKMTLKEALEKNIIGNDGTFNHGQMSLNEALEKKFICNPMTLKECHDNELLTNDNSIKDPVTNKPLTLLEAIGKGVLDVDLKSVKNVSQGQLVSLGQALIEGIIETGSGNFTDTATKEVMSLQEAVKRGHLTTVTKKSIFDIEGIKDQNTGDYVSFNQAKKLGIIDQVTGKFNEHKTNRKISFIEASNRDLLQPQLLEMLKKPIGIRLVQK